MIIYLRLYYEFFKIGLFAIGGGLATLPFLNTLIDTTGWYTTRDLSNLIAVSECTPGALGINMSTYVGNLSGGPFGGIIATLGLISPSIIVIIIIANFLKRFKESVIVQNVFYGLRPASTGLIAVALCSVVNLSLIHITAFQKTNLILDLINIKGLILAVVIWVTLKVFKKHPVVYIAGAALCGILLQF